MRSGMYCNHSVLRPSAVAEADERNKERGDE